MASSNLTIDIDEQLIQDILDLAQFIGYETRLNALNNQEGYPERFAYLWHLNDKHGSKDELAEKVYKAVQDKYRKRVNE